MVMVAVQAQQLTNATLCFQELLMKTNFQAKNGQNLPERDCESPVLAHYSLGNELGISGTPALVFPDGRLIPGYVEVDRLVTMLQVD